MRRSTFQTCPGWYVTPVVFSITSATRARVHRSVGYPFAFGPFWRARSTLVKSASVTLRGPTRRSRASQGLPSSDQPQLVPVGDRLVRHSELTADVGLGHTLGEQIGRPHPGGFHGREIPTWTDAGWCLVRARCSGRGCGSGHAPIIPLHTGLAGY